jgi:hypothetical protein
LQNFKKLESKNIEKFLREAQYVYIKRDEEKQKEKIMLPNIGQVTQKKADLQAQGQQVSKGGYEIWH